MCEFCDDVILQKNFQSTNAWLNCMEYIKELLAQDSFELTEATCDLDKICDKDGKWANDTIGHAIRCKNCGQVFQCSVNTYRGGGGFVKENG